MTLALERLRTLRRQAGGVAGPAAVDGPATAVQSADAQFDTALAAQHDARVDRYRAADAEPCSATPTTGGASRMPSRAASCPRDAQTIDALRRLLRVRAPASAPTHAHAHAHASMPAPARASAPAPLDRTLPGDEIAPGLHLIEHRLPWPVAPVLPLGFDTRIAHAHSADIVCFDTETTGLAGGTGTRAFMIGIAQWRDDALHIRQWFITRLQAERALLAAFAEVLNESSVLVSYNGRSYDAPLLRTRFRLARMHEPLTDCAHVDLLHPTRRRYRGRWENCRLATIERRVLGVVREDDLPGSEAPAAWLRYLRGGCARDLARVAEHNRQDLASLAGLLLHLGGLSDGDAREVDAGNAGALAAAPSA